MVVNVVVILNGYLESSHDTVPNWVPGDSLLSEVFGMNATNTIKVYEWDTFEDFVTDDSVQLENVHFVIHSGDISSMIQYIKYRKDDNPYDNFIDDLDIQDHKGSPDAFRDLVYKLEERGILSEDNKHLDENKLIMFVSLSSRS